MNHVQQLGRPAVLVAGICLVLGQPDRAAAANIKASFTPIRVTAQAGTIYTTSYQVTLQEGEPTVHFAVAVQDWWRSEDGRQSFYATAGSIERSCGTWVSANPRESAVRGGETLDVRLTIRVPENVRPGGYWCALTVDELPDPLATTPDGVAMRFLTSVSTGIYVNIGTIERGVDIASIDVRDDDAIARLVNTGNTPVTVEGRFEFRMPGTARPAVVVALPRHTLLTGPFSTGVYAASLPERSTLPAGRYLVRLVLDIGLDHYIGAERELDITRSAVAHQRDR